jgi:hypothetical protein
MPETNSPQDDPKELSRITTIVLAEFGGLRGEISTRVNLLATMILVNLTVLGVVFGIALNKPENIWVLLILPIVTPLIGLLYLDQARVLSYFSSYIAGHILPKLELKDAPVFRWEPWIVRLQSRPTLALPYVFSLFVQFLGPPIAVLLYANPDNPPPESVESSLNLADSLQQKLWWAGAVLTSIMALYAISYGIYSAVNQRGLEAQIKRHSRYAGMPVDESTKSGPEDEAGSTQS